MSKMKRMSKSGKSKLASRQMGGPPVSPMVLAARVHMMNETKQRVWFEGQARHFPKAYQEGGVIEDPMGQWAHPGEVTRIPSNQITMQGVAYPVLGISDTGHKQMMQPGKNYKFNGKSVTEYPMAELGLSQTGGGGGLQMGGSVLTYQGTGDIQRSDRPQFSQNGGRVEWQIDDTPSMQIGGGVLPISDPKTYRDRQAAYTDSLSKYQETLQGNKTNEDHWAELRDRLQLKPGAQQQKIDIFAPDRAGQIYGHKVNTQFAKSEADEQRNAIKEYGWTPEKDPGAFERLHGLDSAYTSQKNIYNQSLKGTYNEPINTREYRFMIDINDMGKKEHDPYGIAGAIDYGNPEKNQVPQYIKPTQPVRFVPKSLTSPTKVTGSSNLPREKHIVQSQVVPQKSVTTQQSGPIVNAPISEQNKVPQQYIKPKPYVRQRQPGESGPAVDTLRNQTRTELIKKQVGGKIGKSQKNSVTWSIE